MSWVAVITSIGEDDLFWQTVAYSPPKRKPNILGREFSAHMAQAINPRLTFISYYDMTTKQIEVVTFSERLFDA